MKRLLTAFFFCFSLCPSTTAQSRTYGLSIQILDSVSRAKIPAAHIMAVSGRDTINMVTDAQGYVFCSSYFRADSVELTVTHLSYETKKIKVRTPRENSISSAWIELREKVYDIAEIVVVGDQIAVVMKGDTIRFNAEAFKTFEGDPMSKLLEQLPGMKLENDKLTYLGEPIHRVTIDGSRLFGDNVMMALENIRVEDVVDVSVYKETSDWDKLNEIENPELLTVADVKTKSKPSMVRNFTLTAAGGTMIDSDYSEDREALYEGSGKLAYSRVGELLSVNAGVIEHDTRKIWGAITYNSEEVNKYKLSSYNSFNHNDINSVRWENRNYFPTDEWSSRIYYDRNSSANKKNGIISANNFSYTFKNKSIVSILVNCSYNVNVDESANLISAVQDEFYAQNQNILQRNKESSYNLSVNVGYSKRIKSMLLNASGSIDTSNNDGNGWRVDTLSSSTSKLYLENTSGGWSRKFEGKVITTVTLRPQLSVSASYHLNYVDSKTRRISADMLTGTTDPTNSYDYRIHELNNMFTANLTHYNHNNQKGISIASVNVSLEFKDMQRDDYYPKEYVLPKIFDIITTNIYLEYKFSTFSQLKLRYDRSPKSISILDFIELDNSNPLMLRAGNPNLKLGISNNLAVTGVFVKGAATYEFEVGYGIGENTVVEKSRYFSEDTFLPEYNYTALAGSTLITKVNRSGERRFTIKGDYNVRSKKLRSNIRLGLFYRHDRIPAYVNEQSRMINGDNYSASLKISGNFSSIFTPTLSATTNYNSSDNGFVRNEWFSQTFGFEVRLRIAKSIDINGSNNFRWNKQWPDVSGMDRFGIVSNFSLGYKFGKEKNFTISLQGNDLLNRKQRIIINTYADYIATTYMRSIGRYIMLHAEWKF